MIKTTEEIIPLLIADFRQALKHKMDFQMTENNAREIAEICTYLDGLPLAIELAAAYVKLLSPNGLLKRLECGVLDLVGGSRDLPERHQNLRSMIKWSYDLLSVEEQQLFRKLSVFAGGSTLEAVEAVCSLSGDGPKNILNVVIALIDKNLVQRKEQADGEPRLFMLETIRKYAQECLEQSGEADALRHAHAEYYLEMAQQAWRPPGMWSPGSA